MRDSRSPGPAGSSPPAPTAPPSLSFATRLGAITVAVTLLAGGAHAGGVSPFPAGARPAAQPFLVRPNAWNIHGVVHAIVQAGNTIYFGGEFSIPSTHAGCGVPLDPASGALSTSFPVVGGVNSIVYAAADDGHGGWYIAGNFSTVGGLPRNRLAHIRSDGTVAAWNPGADYWVHAIAVEKDVVYVGGLFRTVGGLGRAHLAAIDEKTGVVLPWNPAPDGPVMALTISGRTLYVGGGFSSIAGQSRRNLAAFDSRSGAIKGWSPDTDNLVACLAAHGDRVYVGGNFRSIGGVSRNFLAAVDPDTGVPAAWNPDVLLPPYDQFFFSDIIAAIAVTDDAVYIGGYFSGAGGRIRRSVAALDRSTGVALPWHPQLIGGYGFTESPVVLGMTVSGANVLIGGIFFVNRCCDSPNFVVVDATTGSVRPWNMFADLAVAVVAKGRDGVYVGGAFRTFQELQKGLASIDATTGALTGWNFGFRGTRVNALAVRDSFLYVGGRFNEVAGRSADGLAEIDMRTNVATRFLGSTDGEVRALLAHGSRLYVGGAFSTLYGLPLAAPFPARNGLGAFELDAGPGRGVISSWDPQSDGEVDALASDHATLYAGGRFGRMGGEVRPHLAAVDTATGASTAWNPSADGPVAALAVDHGVVFAGGEFDTVGGATRRNLAALDSRTGLATTWRADADGRVGALLRSGGNLYVGGTFQNVGGSPRSHIAALSAQGALVLPWDPDADGEIGAFATRGATIYAGGAFTSVGGEASEGLVELRAAASRSGSHEALSPGGVGSAPTLSCTPSPVRTVATVQFSVPSDELVTLALYDLAGRRMACPLLRQPVASGMRHVSVSAEMWPPGCYFWRLTAGNTELTRKIVVMR